jgi:hypothetical protein
MVYEEMAHFARNGTEEVSPVPPVRRFPTEQPQVNLMDQARGPQRMTRSFQAHIARSDAPELRVDQRHQFVSRFVVSTAHFFEKRRDITRGKLRHMRLLCPPRHRYGTLRT